MLKLNSFICIVLLVILFNSCFLSAQDTAGRIITRSQALAEFGAVTNSITFSTAELRNILTLTNDKVMFRIQGTEVLILDKNRNCIYPGNRVIPQTDVYKVFSITVVTELMNTGGEAETFFQMRNDVFTITNGDFTGEFSWPCPPFCE